jgi:hypothetical protein
MINFQIQKGPNNTVHSFLLGPAGKEVLNCWTNWKI